MRIRTLRRRTLGYKSAARDGPHSGFYILLLANHKNITDRKIGLGGEMSETLKSILICIALSIAPISELRGGITYGIGLGGLDPWLTYIICVIANMIPVPFIILFIRRILQFMDRRGGVLSKISGWLQDRAQKKIAIYYKYALFGLYVLVAIPLPGTGAWTGALIAAILDLRLKNALPAIALGVATAGIIMLVLSLGVVGLFS